MSLAWPRWVLCSRSSKVTVKVSARLHSLQKAWLGGRICFQTHSRCWQNSFPTNCRTEVPIFIPAFSQELLATSSSGVCHVAFSIVHNVSIGSFKASRGPSLFRKDAVHLMASADEVRWFQIISLLFKNQLIWNLNYIFRILSLLLHTVS